MFFFVLHETPLFIPVADNIHSHTFPVSSPYSHNVLNNGSNNVRRISGHLGPSRDRGLGHIEVPGCFPWRRFADSPAVTSRPDRHGPSRRFVQPASPTARPNGHGIAVFSICQPYTLKSVFAKHQKITKICPLTSFDMFRDRTLVFISYMKSVAARK
jgi:hypothetical protein